MFKKNRDQKIAYGLVLICSLVYISLVWNSNIWMDEAFTATLAHNSFIKVLYLSMMDTLPPLYNIILKITTSVFGYHIPVMKLTSVLPMIFTMLLGAGTIRKRFNLTTAIAFILCITGMPLMLYYGVEIRMYSLGFFFATASGIFCNEVICEDTKANWRKFIIFSVLAGYSHHFAFVAVGFMYLFLLLHYIFGDRKNLKKWFKCLAWTFLLYLPCCVITLIQITRVSGYFSMPDIDLHLFIQYATYPYMVGVMTASILCVLVMFSLLAYAVIRFIANRDRSSATIFSLCCFAVYYGVLLFGTAVSKVMTANIFVDRYLFFSTGLLWLFAAIQIGKLPEKIDIVFLGVLLFISVCSYKVEYNIEYGNSADEEITFLSQNIKEGDLFFDIGGHEEMQNCIPFLSLVSDGPELTYMYPLEDALAAAKANDVTLWISVLDGYEADYEQKMLIEVYGYTPTKVSDFEFDRYKCELYRLDSVK